MKESGASWRAASRLTTAFAQSYKTRVSPYFVGVVGRRPPGSLGIGACIVHSGLGLVVIGVGFTGRGLKVVTETFSRMLWRNDTPLVRLGRKLPIEHTPHVLLHIRSPLPCKFTERVSCMRGITNGWHTRPITTSAISIASTASGPTVHSWSFLAASLKWGGGSNSVWRYTQNSALSISGHCKYGRE